MPPATPVRLVAGPGQVTEHTTSGSRHLDIRAAWRLDDFAAALAPHLPAQVNVTDLANVPDSQDTILIVTPTALTPLLAAGRAPGSIVLLGAELPEATRQADRLGLAAAVDELHYLRWKANPNNRAAAALHGTITAAERLGATQAQRPYQHTDRYTQLHHPDLLTLPALLASYLNAYTQHAP